MNATGHCTGCRCSDARRLVGTIDLTLYNISINSMVTRHSAPPSLPSSLSLTLSDLSFTTYCWYNTYSVQSYRRTLRQMRIYKSTDSISKTGRPYRCYPHSCMAIKSLCPISQNYGLFVIFIFVNFLLLTFFFQYLILFTYFIAWI